MSNWIKYLLSSLIFPIIGFMYITLSNKILSKVDKDNCELRHKPLQESYFRHEKLLNDIYNKVNQTSVDMATLRAKFEK